MRFWWKYLRARVSAQTCLWIPSRYPSRAYSNERIRYRNFNA